MKRDRESQTSENWNTCSDLVSVHWQDPGEEERIETAVLEEIGADGAVVQLENAVDCQRTVRLGCRTAGFDGVVSECWHEKDLGYFAKITFDGDQRWSTDVYRPQHLLGSDDCGLHPSECAKGCGSRDWCPIEYVSRAVDPRIAIDETVRRVAQNVAVVCGDMDAAELAKCFADYFGAPRKCLLFAAFAHAYRSARESLAGTYEQPVSPLRQACSIATLLASVPDEALRTSARVNVSDEA